MLLIYECLGIYGIAGTCYDMVENRKWATTLLLMSLRIDVAYTEAIEYLVNNGLIGSTEKKKLLYDCVDGCGSRTSLPACQRREWLEGYYR